MKQIKTAITKPHVLSTISTEWPSKTHTRVSNLHAVLMYNSITTANNVANLLSKQAQFFQSLSQVFGIDAAILCHVLLTSLMNCHFTSCMYTDRKQSLLW